MRTIRQLFSAGCVATILVFGVPLFVAPTSAQTRPKDATAQCKDGTYSKAQTRRGACSRHGGVATWFADEKADTGSKPATPKVLPQPVPSGKTAGKSGVPENATAKCKDGTFSYAKQHRGACSHHGGVAEWYK